MAKMIKTHNPEYDEFVDSWETMRDTFDGEDKIKEEGLAYLPMKSAVAAMTDLTKKTAAYIAYRDRAEFPELVSATVIGVGGMITDQPPIIELPSQMEYLLEDCDGTGTTLEVFHKKIVTEVLTTGRYGILPGPLEDGVFVLAGYCAERIINWDKDERGRTNFVVLDETEQRRDPDTNVWAEDERYLELMLDEAGNYVAFRWTGETQDAEPIVAMKPDRTAMKTVPFVFVNTLGLQADPDDVPMYGLAKLSLRVYRLDADYVHGLHMTSEPTPYVTGFMNAKDAIDRGEVPTAIGADTLWVLPPSATAGFLEFTGPGLEAQSKAILAALERAVLYGAQILSEKTSPGSESGKSREMRMRGQQSMARNIAKTAAAGLEKALRNIAVWMGLDPKTVTVRPFLDFVDHKMSAQDLTAFVNGWMSGAYSKRTLFENMQRADMIPSERTFEDEEELIQTEGPPPGAGEDIDDGDGSDQDPGNKPGGKPSSAPGD